MCEELEDGDTRPSELGVNLFYAVRPMLSERLDITHIHVLDKTKTYCMEEKFDGERFQVRRYESRTTRGGPYYSPICDFCFNLTVHFLSVFKSIA